MTSDAKTDGGPAFPHGWQLRHNLRDEVLPGMSLRDFFAAFAMAGFVARGPLDEHETEESRVERAYGYADVMLKVRGRLSGAKAEE